MSRPKYRVHVWKSNWCFGSRSWIMGVWPDGGRIALRFNAPSAFPTHAEAVVAGLEWANELNAREQEEA